MIDKKALHALIDETDDPSVLEVVYDLLTRQSEPLDYETIEAIKAAKAEIAAGEWVTSQEVHEEASKLYEDYLGQKGKK